MRRPVLYADGPLSKATVWLDQKTRELLTVNAQRRGLRSESEMIRCLAREEDQRQQRAKPAAPPELIADSPGRGRRAKT